MKSTPQLSVIAIVFMFQAACASKAKQIASEYTFVYRLLLPGTTTARMEVPVDDGFIDKVKRLHTDTQIAALPFVY